MHAVWHRLAETRIVSEGEEPEVTGSSFTNTSTFLTSSGSITIYVPRAFQRIYHNPLILQHVQKPGLLVRLGRNPAMFDIRFRRSSHDVRARQQW